MFTVYQDYGPAAAKPIVVYIALVLWSQDDETAQLSTNLIL